MRALCLVLVAGCFSSPQVGGGDGMPPGEGGGGEKTMTADAQSCFGPASGNFTICLGPGYTNPFPTSKYDVPSDASFDTGEDCTFTQVQDSGLPPLCVKAATNITISARLGTRGAPPLVLLATGDITMAQAGIIDVASHRGLGDGAGTVNCSGGQKAGGSDNNGGGGGAGASFGTIAGNGGAGGGGEGSAGQAIAPTSPPPPGLNGACDGGDGGSGGPGTGGPNGNGGGAVYLVAGGTISIAGTINASGAGARGGTKPKGGGGGGGAGGMIVVFGRDVTFESTAVLVANGGGGGGGATMGSDGGAGADPDLTMATLVGKGGAKGGASSGHGGDGAYDTTPAVPGDSANDGAGGGGGGAGFIRILSGQPTGPARVAPPAITN